jgi:ribosomal protein S18 acetylase RimI-like enzyme
MKTYLEESFSMIKLKAELEDNNSEFYFAELNNNIIGYLKLNWGESQTEIQDENTLEIERIYVLKDVYGKNIGQLLFQKAMDIAVQKKVNYVWLGVWEENLRAINFYKKNGFSEFNKHIFRLGNDEQTDIMMKLEMKAG